MKKLIITDCDGVLTPMHTFYSEEGRLFKMFSSHDSYGIKYLKNLGFEVIIMTSDEYGLPITQKRSADWNINVIYSKDKLNAVRELKEKDDYDVVYFVGNGPEDIVVLEEVDIFFATKDSRPEVKNNTSSKIITLPVKGGCGVLDKVYQYIINEKNGK